MPRPRKLIRVVPFFALLLSTACGSSEESSDKQPTVVEGDAGSVTYKQGVVFMEELDGYIGVEMKQPEQGPTQFRFQFSDPTSVHLAPGNVIVGRHKTPYYFHKVISASVENGMLVVQGEPASLDDAVESADIKASVAIGDSPEPGKFDTWQGEYALPPVSCHYPDLYVVRNQSGSVQARVGTTPNCKVELRGGYEIELRISQRERFFKLTLTANTTGGLGVEGKVNAAAKFQKSVPLLKDWAQVNMISLLGIPIKVSANFEAQLEAAFDGAAQVRVSRSITNKTVVFMQFNNGAWTSGKEDQPNATQIDDDLQLNLGGKANVTAGLESKFSVGFGGHAFGAGLEVDAGVEMLTQLKLAADGKLDVVNPAASQMTYGVDACDDVDLYASTGFHSFIYKKEREWKHDLYANCWDLVDGKLPLK